MKNLKISKELSLPIDAVTQTFAMIGRKGAGKTYLASMIAEQMLDAKAQVVVLDPIGNWYGLRIDKDGKKKGKDIFVIGGDHGDIPIAVEAGARLARLIVDKGISAVLDISGFRLYERKRFATDFAEELLHRKKSNRTPVHIVMEEAQLLIPQRVGRDEARMVGAFEQIVRLGRNYGIGCSLVTQRPQSVNKEVLSQVECLCVLQVTGLHERKALEDWVQEADADRKLIGELPSLERGQGYVWSPAWLKVFKKVRFSQKTTFDASATPEVGKTIKAATLSNVDIEKLKVDMQDIVEKAEQDDPKALRRRIADLEKQLRTGKTDPAAIEKAVRAAEMAKERQFASERDGMIKATGNYLKVIAAIGKTVAPFLEQQVGPDRTKLQGTFVAPVVNSSKPTPAPTAVFSHQGEDIPMHTIDEKPLTGGAKRMVEVLTSKYPMKFTKSSLATLSRMKPTSGTFSTYLSTLRAKGLIVEENGLVYASDDAIAEYGGNCVPMETEDVINMWKGNLTGGAKRMFEILVEHYPLQKDNLAEVAGLSATSGTFSTYLSTLRSNGLIEVQDGEVYLAEILRG